MDNMSISLIMVSLIIFIISFASQIKVIKNEEIKELMKKASDAYVNSFVDFDIPMFVIGIIVSIFYTVVSILRIVIGGKFTFFIKGVFGEVKIMVRTMVSFVYFVVGVYLSVYSMFLEYVLLVFVIFATILTFITMDRSRRA